MGSRLLRLLFSSQLLIICFLLIPPASSNDEVQTSDPMPKPPNLPVAKETKVTVKSDKTQTDAPNSPQHSAKAEESKKESENSAVRSKNKVLSQLKSQSTTTAATATTTVQSAAAKIKAADQLKSAAADEEGEKVERKHSDNAEKNVDPNANNVHNAKKEKEQKEKEEKVEKVEEIEDDKQNLNSAEKSDDKIISADSKDQPQPDNEEKVQKSNDEKPPRPIQAPKNDDRNDVRQSRIISKPRDYGRSSHGSTLIFICVLFILLFLVFHYKKKILGLIVEGRVGKRQGGTTRRPGTNVRYRRLSTNDATAADTADKNFVS